MLPCKRPQVEQLEPVALLSSGALLAGSPSAVGHTFETTHHHHHHHPTSFTPSAPGLFAADPESRRQLLDALLITNQNQGVIPSLGGVALPDQGLTGEAYTRFANDPGPRSGHDRSGAWYGLPLDVTLQRSEASPDRGDAPKGTAANGLLGGLALFDSRHPGIDADSLGQGGLTAELIPLEELPLARVAALLPADADRTSGVAVRGEVTEWGDAPCRVPDADAHPTTPPRHRTRTLADLLLPNPLLDRGEETNDRMERPYEQPKAPGCPPQVPEASGKEGRLPGEQGRTAGRWQVTVFLWFAAGLTRASLDRIKNGTGIGDEVTRVPLAGGDVPETASKR